MTEIDTHPFVDAIATLRRRGVVTTNPEDAAECCGIPRDADGFCILRPGHPVFIRGSDAEEVLDDDAI